MRTFAGMQKRSSHRYEQHTAGGYRSRAAGANAAQTRQWHIQPADDRREKLAAALKVSPLLAQLLINRGITDVPAAAAFLRPRLSGLISPEQLPGMADALARIKKAITGKEKITIYGDYDVDGITAVAILWQILTLLGANVDYYIPHSIEEGYGLNTGAVRAIAKAGSSLLVTVDCGITAHASAKLAGELGLELIITDHHRPDDKLPPALAIVHPATDPAYQNQDSSGSMVAFKLGWAVANEFKTGSRLDGKIRDFMINATSLAAMGTIADVMDLRGENRILASFGLKSLPDCKLVGIQALIASAGLAGKGLDSFDIGFRLAPMLNAAGRLGHARLAVELLTSDNPTRAARIAEYLKDQNAKRQRLEKKIFHAACEIIVAKGLNHPDRKSIVLADESWHAGVIGIVASRIVDKFCRPAIVINSSGELAQGSARSVPGFDILKAICVCSEHLESFGGHEMAAGVTLQPEKIPEFVEDIEAYAKENLADEAGAGRLNIDALAELSEFSYHTVNELRLLGPFGQANPQPMFATKGVRLCAPPRRVGATGDHLQLAITDNTNSIRCIAFRFGRLEKKLLENEFFNVAYSAQLDTYNGNKNVQLVVRDIKFD